MRAGQASLSDEQRSFAQGAEPGDVDHALAHDFGGSTGRQEARELQAPYGLLGRLWDNVQGRIPQGLEHSGRSGVGVKP